MSPVSTEILNEDIKELKADLHKLDVGLAELRQEVKDAIGIAKWVATLMVGLLLTSGVGGLVTGVWWASKITSKVEAVEASIASALGQPRAPVPGPEIPGQPRPFAAKPTDPAK
jgi:hypothetical protein